MATLVAAALDDGAAGPGAHARPEAVLALTATSVRLVCAFHEQEIQTGEFGDRAVGYEASRGIVKGDKAQSGASR